MWRGGLGGCCFVGLIRCRGENGKWARDAVKKFGARVARFALGDM